MEGIVLINEEEIKAAVSTLYKSGLVVEPSGSAAFAAIVSNNIPDLEGKNVVCILSGGNIGKDEVSNFSDWKKHNNVTFLIHLSMTFLFLHLLYIVLMVQHTVKIKKAN